MLAAFIILINAAVLVIVSAQVREDWLRITCWVLATIFSVSFVQAMVNRYGKD